MKCLVTGAAGFIGFHVSKSLLQDSIEVLGIDNINDYYDKTLKLNRIDNLNFFKNFKFKRADISNRLQLEKIFITFKPDKVINLAAQAGVRYSIDNPYAYLDSNLTGFLNILEMCKKFDIKGLIYASSSSVYGNSKKIPFNIEHRTDKPIAFYGATKKANELMAYTYSHLYGLRTTGLRYFTVYGPWGRPDMALHIFTKYIISKEKLTVYNNGNMKRDFTYIDDVVIATKNALIKNYKCEIFNIGRSRSEKLMDMVKVIEGCLNLKADICYEPIQPGDIKESFANISKTTKMLNYNPQTNIDLGIPIFIEWYKKYYKI